MTRVIRNSEGLYFKSGGAWTAHFDDAQRFRDIQAVIAASREFHLSSVEMVLVINDRPSNDWDIVLRLTDEQRAQ